MLKLIKIGNQTGAVKRNPNDIEFAIFDTKRNKFLEFNNEQVWWSFGAFQHDVMEELDTDEDCYYSVLMNLIPEEMK